MMALNPSWVRTEDLDTQMMAWPFSVFICTSGPALTIVLATAGSTKPAPSPYFLKLSCKAATKLATLLRNTTGTVMTEQVTPHRHMPSQAAIQKLVVIAWTERHSQPSLCPCRHNVEGRRRLL